MGLANIKFSKNQRYYFWKYNGLICKLIYRKKTHYWSLQSGNRHLKTKETGNSLEDNIKQTEELLFIYRNTQTK